MNVAIVCAYRREEADLPATQRSAMESAGAESLFYGIEDAHRAGPARTRNFGIEQADDADVIILIDAHMRFDSDVLRRMARKVYEDGGLICPLCHHDAPLSMDGHLYAGARIVWTCEENGQRKPLDAKWSKDTRPGKRACVMGACYAFRRDWYMRAGRPLAMLPGWGGDEAALSIAAWLTGWTPEVIDGHVAHLYRPTPPWAVTAVQIRAMAASQAALVSAFATPEDAAELLAWSRLDKWSAADTPEVRTVRYAMERQARKWEDWKRAMCDPAETI